ncbi:MAG: Sodium/glutamate symporter [uncultured Gemmatimonadetes bacterium]|uniref:Sodium/glutamate symporter n=1 Tax=uncultured Gemmatimonadota bacterium TaxID=203437 RepID=A0A6J4LFS9_9BACT|nr:MAG: Sodium/glutamate symporter [uncultured Gemmatimonadota bacterium]
MLKLDLIHTLAFAGLVLMVGYGVRAALPVLARYNIPGPVIGGLIASVVGLVAHSRGTPLWEFDTTLQAPLMIAFFTTIGFAASLRLLRVGGPQVLVFFAIATVFAVVQNVVGAGMATLFGLHPLFGVLTGSVTLTGGPATGLAFAPVFERAGVEGATTVAVASAMVGIVFGGVIGGPIGTRLVERYRLHDRLRTPVEMETPVATELVEAQLPEPSTAAPEGEDESSWHLLKAVVLILVAMWAGSWVSAAFTSLGVTLPAYIGAMLVAALIRNVDDAVGWIGVSQRTIDDVGNVALALFIAMALMTLKLWEISNLALPMLAILAVQVILVAIVCAWPVFPAMGRDYDAAVMGSGFAGFMLGTTANAMANMRSLVERYGPAPRAFLVVPMVGAFFIDFTNAVIITVFVNLLA